MWVASSHTYIHTLSCTAMLASTSLRYPCHTYIHIFIYFLLLYVYRREDIAVGRPDLGWPPVLDEGGRLFLITVPGPVSRSKAPLHHPSPRRSRERRAPQQAPQTTHRQTHTHMVRQVTYGENPSFIHKYIPIYMHDRV